MFVKPAVAFALALALVATAAPTPNSKEETAILKGKTTLA